MTASAGYDRWADIDEAAIHLARIYDGATPSDARRRQWVGLLWTWISRARKRGSPRLPTMKREGRRVVYRLGEVQKFAAKYRDEA